MASDTDTPQPPKSPAKYKPIPPKNIPRKPGDPIKSRQKRTYIFRTIEEAEKTLIKVANQMHDRERSMLHREAARVAWEKERERVRQVRNQCQLDGIPPDGWPEEPVLELPPIVGVSSDVGGKVVSAVNGFILARRLVLSREIAERETAAEKRVKELEEEVRQMITTVDMYRRQLAEATARAQAMMQ